MPQAQLNLTNDGDAVEFQRLFAAYHDAEHDKGSKEFRAAELALRTKIAQMNLRDLMSNERTFAKVVGL